MYKELLVLLVCLLASFLYGLDASLMRLSEVSNPIVLAGVRLIGTFVILVIAFRRLPRIRKSHRFIFCIICSIASSLFFIAALTLVPVVDAMLLFYGSMIWSCVWKWIARTPVRRVDFYTAIAVFLGICLLIYQPHHAGEYLGYLFGLISGASFAGFLFNVERMQESNSIDNKAGQDAFMFAIMIIILISLPYYSVFSQDSLSLNQRILLLGDGAIYGIAYCLLFYMLRKAAAHLVNTYLGAFEPICGIICAYFLLSQEIRIQAYFGTFLIITAIAIRGIVISKSKA